MKELKHCTRHPGHRSCEDRARPQQDYDRILASWERKPSPEQGYWVMVVIYLVVLVIANLAYKWL